MPQPHSPSPDPTTRPTTRDEAPLTLRAAFAPNTINVEARTVDLIWTTGAGVKRYDWDKDRYYIERLRVSPEAIDMTRMNSGAPLLAQHNQYALTGTIGVVERAWIEGGKGYATVRFSRRDDVEELWRDVQDGILRNVSVGYFWDRVADTDDKVEGFPVREVTRWTPYEISIVSVGADAGAQVRSHQSHQEETMEPTPETPPAAPGAPAATPATPTTEARAQPVDERAVREAANKAVAAERERAREIRKIVVSVGLSEDVALRLIDEGVTLDAARAHVIDELAAADTARRPTTVGGNDRERGAAFSRQVVDGLAFRLGTGPRPESEDARHFGARGLLYVAERMLSMGGVNTGRMTEAQIAQRAMVTSDFVHIIHDVADRSLRAGYEAETRLFVPIFRPVSAANFKPIDRTLLSDMPDLLPIAELGPYVDAEFTEAKESYAVAKHGRSAGFSWEMMINQRYDSIGRVPQMFGNSAARLENNIAWQVATGNATTGGAMPNLSDGDPLYGNAASALGADRANQVAVDLDAASLAAARLYFRTRETENGQKMNLTPTWLVVGPDLEDTAEKLLVVLPEYQTTSRDNTMSASYRNSLSLAVESRIPEGHWYMFAPYMAIDTCEYAYLDGHERPLIERSETDQFLTDRIDIKVRHIFGAGAIDRRGLYRSVGA